MAWMTARPMKRKTSPRIGVEGMGYLLRRILLAAAPFLWRKFKQRRRKG